MIFNNAITYVGTQMNTSTGLFTATASGVYNISASASLSGTGVRFLVIRVNSTDVFMGSNLALPQQNQQMDPVYSPDRVFYRIKEIDIDGHSSYSIVVGVSAENAQNTFILFPNPVGDRFYLSGDNVAGLKLVQLFSGGGVWQATWEGPQDSYPVNSLAAGIYYVRLTTTDGSIQYQTMIKNKLFL